MDSPVFVNPLDRKIFWLASYPKSGNTWVRMFLNAYITGFPVNLNSAYQFVSGDFRPELFQMMVTRPINQLTIKEQYYFYPGLLLNILGMSNTLYVCLKTHHAKVKVDEIPLIPVELTEKAIYVMRDPRDIVPSLADHFGLTLDKAIDFLGNEQQGAEQKGTGLTHLLLSWRLHVKSWASKPSPIETIIIKYEELLGNPRGTFEKIIAAFNFEMDEARFDFALEQTKFKNLQKMEQEGTFREKSSESKKFFREGKAGNWKNVLSRGQAKRIESEHREEMKTFGYL